MACRSVSPAQADNRLEHVEVRDAGLGSEGIGGAVRLMSDPGGLLRNTRIVRSATCGIFLSTLHGGTWAEDYTAPAFGNSFVELSGPARCML